MSSSSFQSEVNYEGEQFRCQLSVTVAALDFIEVLHDILERCGPELAASKPMCLCKYVQSIQVNTRTRVTVCRNAMTLWSVIIETIRRSHNSLSPSRQKASASVSICEWKGFVSIRPGCKYSRVPLRSQHREARLVVRCTGIGAFHGISQAATS